MGSIVRRTVTAWMFVTAGVFLALNLVLAVLDGGRASWVAVAVLALAMAASLWRRGRTPPE